MKTMILLLALGFALLGCSRRMPPPTTSPTGKFRLVTSTRRKQGDPAYGCLVIEIFDATGKVFCHTNTGAKAFGWTMEWTSDNQVVINCRDNATDQWVTQHWDRQADGSWKKK